MNVLIGSQHIIKLINQSHIEKCPVLFCDVCVLTFKVSNNYNVTNTHCFSKILNTRISVSPHSFDES